MTTQKYLLSALISRCRSRVLPRALASALLILFVAAGTAAAQSGSGVAAIEGTVTDPDTRAVAGALVMIISSETGYDRTVVH